MTKDQTNAEKIREEVLKEFHLFPENDKCENIGIHKKIIDLTIQKTKEAIICVTCGFPKTIIRDPTILDDNFLSYISYENNSCVECGYQKDGSTIPSVAKLIQDLNQKIRADERAKLMKEITNDIPKIPSEVFNTYAEAIRADERAKLLDEMISKHKIPENMKVVPENISTENMFSFAESYAEMRVEHALKTTGHKFGNAVRDVTKAGMALACGEIIRKEKLVLLEKLEKWTNLTESSCPIYECNCDTRLIEKLKSLKEEIESNTCEKEFIKSGIESIELKNEEMNREAEFYENKIKKEKLALLEKIEKWFTVENEEFYNEQENKYYTEEVMKAFIPRTTFESLKKEVENNG